MASMMTPDTSASSPWPGPAAAPVLWEALSQDSGVKVAVIDDGGAVVVANKAYARSFARATPATLAGRPLTGFLPEDFAREHVELARRALDSACPMRLRTVWRGVPQEVTFRPLPGRRAVLLTVSCEPGAPPPDSAGIRTVRARHADEGPIAVLSPRERKVLGLIGAGLPTASIARILGRSTKTIENQRLSMGRKLGVSNRVELARIAIQSGLVAKVPIAKSSNGEARARASRSGAR